MIRIIVTGADGQLGQSIRAASHAYVDIDFVYTDVGELDITQQGALVDYAKTLSSEMPTIVINCAAYTAVDRAESEREQAELLNHTAARYLASACATLGYMMVQVSTDYVFDGKACTPYAEDAPKHPLGVYGSTKARGEEEVITALQDRGLVVRTSWLYSPYGRNFVLSMLSLAEQRSRIGVVADQVGSPTYAPHLAEALIQVALQAVSEGRFACPVVHYTNSGVCSWYDLAYYSIERCLGKGEIVAPIKTSEYPTPATRPAYSVLSKSRLKECYGIVPPHWMQGVEELRRHIHNRYKDE